MFNLFENHAVLLLDKVRMGAYRRAIRKVIKPGMVVADIGCGLGALTFMALEHGAKKVYAMEVDPPTLELAKVIASYSSYKNRIQFIKGLSYHVKLPERVDVVVSETLGNLGLNENIASVLKDAKRFLRKDGHMIPAKIKVGIAPVEHKKWIESVKKLGQFLPDDPAVPLGIQSREIHSEEFLADEKRLFDVAVSNPPRFLEKGVSFKMARDGILSGFAGWFEVVLAGGIRFSTHPGFPLTHWKQAFLPLRRPEKRKRGERVDFSIRMEPGGTECVTEYAYEGATDV